MSGRGASTCLRCSEADMAGLDGSDCLCVGSGSVGMPNVKECTPCGGHMANLGSNKLGNRHGLPCACKGLCVGAWDVDEERESAHG